MLVVTCLGKVSVSEVKLRAGRQESSQTKYVVIMY
jgi:hypothetical protein